MSTKPIPTHGPFGTLSERFLIIKDGRVVVKDGRTLEEYINDPRFVALRKKYKIPDGIEMACVPYDAYLFGIHHAA